MNSEVSTYENETKIIVSSTVDSSKFIQAMCEILSADSVMSEVESLNKTEKIGDSFEAVS